MNSSIVKANGNGEVVSFDPETFQIPGMENVQPGELRVPLLKLVQAQSRMDGAKDHGGEWHNSVTGEFEANPELLVIGLAKGRVMFPDEYNADNKPLCGSNDGTHPRDEYKGNQLEIVVVDVESGRKKFEMVGIGEKCEGCPFAQWGPNGEPPKCGAVETFAGVGADGLPALIQIRGSGLKNVPNLKTMLAANGIRKTVRLGSVLESNESGTYHVPVFLLGNKPGKELQGSAMRLAALGNLAARNQQAVIEYENRNREDVGGPRSEGGYPPPPDVEDDWTGDWQDGADIPF